MQKQTFFSAIRALLTFAGTFLVGHAIWGQAFTNANLDIISGVIIALVSTIWGIADKTASIEQVESALRSIIISAGGLATAAGWVKSETVTALVGLVTGLLPIFQSYFSKVKVVQIDKGVISTNAQTGKVTKNAA